MVGVYAVCTVEKSRKRLSLSSKVRCENGRIFSVAVDKLSATNSPAEVEDLRKPSKLNPRS